MTTIEPVRADNQDPLFEALARKNAQGQVSTDAQDPLFEALVKQNVQGQEQEQLSTQSTDPLFDALKKEFDNNPEGRDPGELDEAVSKIIDEMKRRSTTT